MPRLPITAPTLQGAGRSPLAQGVLLALAAAALLLAPFLVDALLGRAEACLGRVGMPLELPEPATHLQLFC